MIADSEPLRQPGRLPGGLGIWRAGWLVVRHGEPGLGLIIFWAVMVGVALRLDGFALPLICGVLSFAVLSRLNRPGTRVTAQSQPALHALVHEVARRIGVEPPIRIWLTGVPVVAARVTVVGQRELLIGAPLLAGLATAELRPLIAYELSLLRHTRPRLVLNLHHQWVELTSESLAAAEDGHAPRATARRRTLDRFAAEVTSLADRDAITAAGGSTIAARAFALAHLTESEYRHFLEDSGTPPGRRWLLDRGISDLDDGWRRAVRHGVGETEWDADEAALLAALHPELAAPLAGLGGAALPLDPATEPLPLAPLHRREQRRMTRQVLGLPLPRYISWKTFAETPTKWWARRAGEQADTIRELVGLVLGRPPEDDVETIVVLMTRPREYAAAVLDCPVEELDEPRREPQVAAELPATVVVEDALLRRGWRLEHPAVRGVLVGPDGTRIDARDLVRSVAQGQPGLADLRRTLGAGGTAPGREG
jgi:hypothetical protein